MKKMEFLMKRKIEDCQKKTSSFTYHVVVIMAALLAGTVLLCWIMNAFFLGVYYQELKKTTIKNVYHYISSASKSDLFESEEFDVTMENICSKDNISYIVISADGTIVKSSASNNEELRDQFMDTVFLQERDQISSIEVTDEYVLKQQKDSRLDAEYLVLWGTLPDGNFIMVRSALESIRESAEISNRFLTVVGICVSLIGILVMCFVAKRITRPIVQLTQISKKMADLDFEVKYQGHSYSEVDELGENMNQLSSSLERTISELKAANNELKLDNERKTEIDEIRKEFLSNVSHELKTPLALIQGYAEGLKEGINDDKESRDFYCEVIMDETTKMNKMVMKLLTLNQLEFGKDTVSMDRFDVTELIQGVLNASSLMIKQKEINVEFKETAPMYVWADEFKLEEVITNYISNAINHCDFEKTIKIYYTQKEDCIRISVFNTGKQIPEEDIDKVWIKFYKVDKARTREYGGSGIGLSIVKAIMDSFNRECGVCNHEDGVEFWLELDTKNNL